MTDQRSTYNSNINANTNINPQSSGFRYVKIHLETHNLIMLWQQILECKAVLLVQPQTILLHTTLVCLLTLTTITLGILDLDIMHQELETLKIDLWLILQIIMYKIGLLLILPLHKINTELQDPSKSLKEHLQGNTWQLHINKGNFVQHHY